MTEPSKDGDAKEVEQRAKEIDNYLTETIPGQIIVIVVAATSAVFLFWLFFG